MADDELFNNGKWYGFGHAHDRETFDWAKELAQDTVDRAIAALCAERDALAERARGLTEALHEIERETYTEDGMSYRRLHSIAQRALAYEPNPAPAATAAHASEHVHASSSAGPREARQAALTEAVNGLIAVFRLMEPDDQWKGWENGDGEEIGLRIEEAIKAGVAVLASSSTETAGDGEQVPCPRCHNTGGEWGGGNCIVCDGARRVPAPVGGGK